ncbi:hypothetical protein GVAV_003495 [Gurleya vavrai]
MNLILSDTKIFKSIIKALSSTTNLTFKITPENFCIYTIDINKYFFTFPQAFFSVDDNKNFTLLTAQIFQILDLIPFKSQIEIQNSFKIIGKFSNALTKIKIPLVSFIDYDYEEISDISTKFITKASNIKFNFKGIVNYSIQNENLIIRRDADEFCEEIEMFNVDFIEKGFLNFTCSNSWIDVFEILKDEIDSVLFLFSKNFLSVQFLFIKYEQGYGEIQIPRSLIDK